MNEEPTLSGFSAADRLRPTLGQTLRAARLEKGLELDAIANETRIPLRHLVAIEADDHEALPALPYTMGFVRTLARAIGVDADAAAVQYRAETSKLPHVPSVVHLEPVDESRVPPRWLVAAAIAVIAIILAAVWAYGEGMFQGSAPRPAASAEIVQAAPAPASAVVETPAPAADEAPAAGEPPAVDATASGVVAPESAPVDPAAAPAAAATGSVVITATDEVWFKVYDKGTRQAVKMGILKPGERYVVPGDRDDLLLWTGKAGALRISVNGKALAPLGGPEEMVRDVSLTPAALLARPGD